MRGASPGRCALIRNCPELSVLDRVFPALQEMEKELEDLRGELPPGDRQHFTRRIEYLRSKAASLYLLLVESDGPSSPVSH
jgi:hypothetical protein